MENKTYKILNLIARYVSNNKVIYEEDLIEDLMNMGFEMNEIDAALYWLETMGIDINQIALFTNSKTYLRVITKEEINSLTKDAMNYLYILKKKGLIDDDMFEDILEKVVIADMDIKLDINEIKLLTALTAFSGNKKLFNYVVENEGEVIYN